jgi:hypothetical protein
MENVNVNIQFIGRSPLKQRPRRRLATAGSPVPVVGAALAPYAETPAIVWPHAFTFAIVHRGRLSE